MYVFEHNLIYKHQYGFRPDQYIIRPLKSIWYIRPQHINPQTTILRYTQHRIKLKITYKIENNLYN